MSTVQNQKLAERNIPGMMNRRERFAEPEHADDAGATVRRIFTYFMRERTLVIGMLVIVVSGTLCGIYAPSLQSNAVDIIAGEKTGVLSHTLLFMLFAYLLYSVCGLLQGLISARLSQNVVKRMREELFGKIMGLPVRYLDTHSHGDVMSRMTNDIENISTTVSQSLPSLFSGVLTVIGTVAVMLWYCLFSSLLFHFFARRHILNIVLLNAAAILIQGVIHYFFYYAIWEYDPSGKIFTREFLPVMIYTEIAVLPFYYAVRFLVKHLGLIDENYIEEKSDDIVRE